MASIRTYVPKQYTKRLSKRKMLMHRIKFWEGRDMKISGPEGLHPLLASFIAATMLVGSVALIVSNAPSNPLDVDWGSWETLGSFSTGLHGEGRYGDFRLYSNPCGEAVVLDHSMYLTATSDINATLMTYSPSRVVQDDRGWNFSFEAYLPKNMAEINSHWIGNSSVALVVYLRDSSQQILSGVKLTAGNITSGTAKVYDASLDKWKSVSNLKLGGYFHRGEITTLKPDGMVVWFSCEFESTECRITIAQTTGKILFSGNVTMPFSSGKQYPSLRFDLDCQLCRRANLTVAAGWFVDNMAIRSLESKYVIVQPVYERILKDESVWLKITDFMGNSLSNAHVKIDGKDALFYKTTHFYYASLPLAVDWTFKLEYSILFENALINDWLYVTVEPDLDVGVEYLPRYWNGWDWATIAGTDDSLSPSDGISKWQLMYDHPVTCHIVDTVGGGTSQQLIPSKSEIAMHYPHDYSNWLYKSYDAATDWAEQAHDIIERTFDFASRWDDPSYVGKGDTYISVGNPGNGASLQLMYAHYAAGTRIMGGSSNDWTAQGHSMHGSWHLLTGGMQVDSNAWNPVEPIDLLDVQRQWEMEGVLPWGGLLSLANNGGVLSMYSHGYNFDRVPMLDWIMDEKTNFSHENWKATSGELASYIFGSQTTDVVKNDSLSTTDLYVYDISRQSPYERGYWNIPVTIGINILENNLTDIQVIEDGRTLSMKEGTLRNLSGARIMDVGYDLRTGNDNALFSRTLFVSCFWNASSQLRVLFNSTGAQSSSKATILFHPESANAHEQDRSNFGSIVEMFYGRMPCVGEQSAAAIVIRQSSK